MYVLPEVFSFGPKYVIKFSHILLIRHVNFECRTLFLRLPCCCHYCMNRLRLSVCLSVVHAMTKVASPAKATLHAGNVHNSISHVQSAAATWQQLIPSFLSS